MVIGVTMRRLRQEKSGDMHDALSQDWGRFLRAVGVAWLPLPNRGQETRHMAQELGLSGIILSGGGVVGQEQERDATERALLLWASARGVPVLGICRGFQAMQVHLGGDLVSVRGHVGTKHAITAAPDAPPLLRERVVNSFHEQAIAKAAQGLTPLAFSRAEDGTDHVEAACGKNTLGLMWHPERQRLPEMQDISLIRDFFGGRRCYASCNA